MREELTFQAKTVVAYVRVWRQERTGPVLHPQEAECGRSKGKRRMGVKAGDISRVWTNGRPCGPCQGVQTASQEQWKAPNRFLFFLSDIRFC